MHRRSSSHPQRTGHEAGFTLLEVMVVVLVLGILLAIGTPTYLGARDRSRDRAAQAALGNGVRAASVVYAGASDYRGADAAGLRTVEPALVSVDSPTASTGPNELSITPNAIGTAWGAAALSDSGTCFFIRADAAGVATYGASDTRACTGAEALMVAGSDWDDTENGIVNGFVSDLSIGGYWNTHGADSLIGGEWQVVSGSVDANITHSSQFAYSVGGQFLDLNGNDAGHIRRQVNVIPNTPYTLTMDVGENVYGGPAIKQMEIIWNGVVIDTVDVDVPALEVESMTFTIPPSAANNGVLEIRSLLPSAHGPTIGNVRLTPVG